jgi:hypothetical protein
MPPLTSRRNSGLNPAGLRGKPPHSIGNDKRVRITCAGVLKLEKSLCRD